MENIMGESTVVQQGAQCFLLAGLGRLNEKKRRFQLCIWILISCAPPTGRWAHSWDLNWSGKAEGFTEITLGRMKPPQKKKKNTKSQTLFNISSRLCQLAGFLLKKKKNSFFFINQRIRLLTMIHKRQSLKNILSTKSRQGSAALRQLVEGG